VLFERETGLLYGVKELTNAAPINGVASDKVKCAPLLDSAKQLCTVDVRAPAARRALVRHLPALRGGAGTQHLVACNAWRLLDLWTPSYGGEALQHSSRAQIWRPRRAGAAVWAGVTGFVLVW
jgi:hypothetical protein